MFSDVVPFDDIPGTLPGSTLPELCPDFDLAPAGDITEIFGSAVTRERALAFSDVSSVAVIDRWLTESASIPPFVPPGTIFPDHSWWIKVAATVAQDPVISATGPSVGGP